MRRGRWAHRCAFVLLVAAVAAARCADAIIISVRGALAPHAAPAVVCKRPADRLTRVTDARVCRSSH